LGKLVEQRYFSGAARGSLTSHTLAPHLCQSRRRAVSDRWTCGELWPKYNQMADQKYVLCPL